MAATAAAKTQAQWPFGIGGWLLELKAWHLAAGGLAKLRIGCRARWRRLFLAALLLLIAGCAGVPLVREAGDARGEGFQVQGQLAVVAGRRAFSARFHWRQTGQRYDIAVWGPLGQGRTRLLGDAERVQIIGPEGAAIAAGPAQEVMQAQLGWRLPLAALPHWIQGRPAPAGRAQRREWDAEGRLTAFRQLGWTVRCGRFREAPSGPLPGLVTAQRPGYRVRVAVSRLSMLPQP